MQNYITFFTSSNAAQVLGTTAMFTLFTVSSSMLLGLLIALTLNRRLPGVTLARSAVFAPYVISGVGVGLVWLFIFDPAYGALSWVLRGLKISSPQWINDPALPLMMVIIVYVWKNLGYCAVVYLAGLQSIPRDLMEAAALDGAGTCRRFLTIGLPLLSPTHVLPPHYFAPFRSAGFRHPQDHDPHGPGHKHLDVRSLPPRLRCL